MPPSKGTALITMILEMLVVMCAIFTIWFLFTGLRGF